MIDAIQSEYGWSDEQVLCLTLARLNQIRDAMFIRAQSERFVRHYEYEWLVKRVASVIVASSQNAQDKKWAKALHKDIVSWDMDAKPEDAETTMEGLDSEEAIEAMWQQGADAAMTANMSKPSLTEMRFH